MVLRGRAHSQTRRPPLSAKDAGDRAPPKKGNLKAIGYELSFQTFVLQDWDKTNEPDIKQTPIGGDSIIEWAIHAEAIYDKAVRKKWKVNFAKKQASKNTDCSE